MIKISDSILYSDPDSIKYFITKDSYSSNGLLISCVSLFEFDSEEELLNVLEEFYDKKIS